MHWCSLLCFWGVSYLCQRVAHYCCAPLSSFQQFPVNAVAVPLFRRNKLTFNYVSGLQA